MKDALTSSQELRESMEFMFNHGLHDSGDVGVVVVSENDTIISDEGTAVAAGRSYHDQKDFKPESILLAQKRILVLCPKWLSSTQRLNARPIRRLMKARLPVELSQVSAHKDKPAPISQSFLRSQDCDWGSNFHDSTAHQLPPMLDKSQTKPVSEATKAVSEYEMLSTTLQLVHVENLLRSIHGTLKSL
ncbi:hypothetical protein MHU86_14095 [Fragilaria crotonensis]|nr:hypothetical protein MHU86_14095 [Fragilaria crotonensis]